MRKRASFREIVEHLSEVRAKSLQGKVTNDEFDACVKKHQGKVKNAYAYCTAIFKRKHGVKASMS